LHSLAFVDRCIIICVTFCRHRHPNAICGVAYHIVVTLVLIAQKIPPNVQTLFSHFDDDHDGFIELGLLLPPLKSVVLHVFFPFAWCSIWDALESALYSVRF